MQATGSYGKTVPKTLVLRSFPGNRSGCSAATELLSRGQNPRTRYPGHRGRNVSNRCANPCGESVRRVSKRVPGRDEFAHAMLVRHWNRSRSFSLLGYCSERVLDIEGAPVRFANLLRCCGSQRVAPIDLRSSVDKTEGCNASFIRVRERTSKHC